MKFRILGRTGLSVSELGFGALEVGRDWPNWRRALPDFRRPEESDAIRLLHEAVDKGINFFDTAPAYFKSEEVLGKAFQKGREKIIIATKCGEWFDGERSVYDYSASETVKFIENSLRLLKTDYIDLLQIHSAPVDVVQKGETLSALMKARQEGKVRFLGISTEHAEAARLALESDEYDSIQVSFNLLQREFERDLFPLARSKSKGVIIKGGMGGGQLTSKFQDIEDRERLTKIAAIAKAAAARGVTLHECALRFVLSSPDVSTVIIGTKDAAHLRLNIEAAQRGPLEEEFLNDLRPEVLQG